MPEDEIMVLLRPAPGADSGNDRLIVSNIGSSGEDGVRSNIGSSGLDGNSVGRTTTSENGEFWFTGLLPGTYVMLIFPPDPIEALESGWLMTVRVGDGTVGGHVNQWTDHNIHDPGMAAADTARRGVSDDAVDDALDAAEEAAREAAEEAARDSARDAAGSAGRRP